MAAQRSPVYNELSPWVHHKLGPDFFFRMKGKDSSMTFDAPAMGFCNTKEESMNKNDVWFAERLAILRAKIHGEVVTWVPAPPQPAAAPVPMAG